MLASEPQLAPPLPARATAIGMLALCCLLWGWSFPVAQFGIAPFEQALRHSLGLGPADFSLALRAGLSATFNAWRFVLTAVLYGALTWRRQRNFTRAELLGGLLVGLCFAAGMVTQNIGLRYTRPSVSGFLTALLVVFAPLAQAAFLRRPVGGRTWLAVALALVGAVVLSVPTGIAARHTVALAAPLPWMGEILTVIGAMFFTGQVLAVDHYGPRVDATRLTLVLFVSTALLTGALGAALGARPLYSPAALAAIGQSTTFWWTMCSLVVFSSVLALHVMNVYQPRVTPATASVIYCLEPLFATAFSVLFQTEHLTATVLAGGTLIILAVLLVARGGVPQAAAPTQTT